MPEVIQVLFVLGSDLGIHPSTHMRWCIRWVFIIIQHRRIFRRSTVECILHAIHRRNLDKDPWRPLLQLYRYLILSSFDYFHFLVWPMYYQNCSCISFPSFLAVLQSVFHVISLCNLQKSIAWLMTRILLLLLAKKLWRCILVHHGWVKVRLPYRRQAAGWWYRVVLSLCYIHSMPLCILVHHRSSTWLRWTMECHQNSVL